MTNEQAIELWKLLSIYEREYRNDLTENQQEGITELKEDIEESLEGEQLLELNI